MAKHQKKSTASVSVKGNSKRVIIALVVVLVCALAIYSFYYFVLRKKEDTSPETEPVGIGGPSPTPSPTPSPGGTPSPSPTPTPSPSPVPTPTPSPTPSPSPSPVSTPTPTPSPSPGVTPSPTPTPSPVPDMLCKTYGGVSLCEGERYYLRIPQKSDRKVRVEDMTHRTLLIRNNKTDPGPADVLGNVFYQYKFKHSSPGKFKIQWMTSEEASTSWVCEKGGTGNEESRFEAACVEADADEFAAIPQDNGSFTLFVGSFPVVFHDIKNGWGGKLKLERRCAIDEQHGLNCGTYMIGDNMWKIKPEEVVPPNCSIL